MRKKGGGDTAGFDMRETFWGGGGGKVMWCNIFGIEKI